MMAALLTDARHVLVQYLTLVGTISRIDMESRSQH